MDRLRDPRSLSPDGLELPRQFLRRLSGHVPADQAVALPRLVIRSPVGLPLCRLLPEEFLHALRLLLLEAHQIIERSPEAAAGRNLGDHGPPPMSRFLKAPSSLLRRSTHSFSESSPPGLRRQLRPFKVAASLE